MERVNGIRATGSVHSSACGRLAADASGTDLVRSVIARCAHVDCFIGLDGISIMANVAKGWAFKIWALLAVFPPAALTLIWIVGLRPWIAKD